MGAVPLGGERANAIETRYSPTSCVITPNFVATSIWAEVGGKEFDSMYIRFDAIPECDGQTHRRTNLLQQYRAVHAQTC